MADRIAVVLSKSRQADSSSELREQSIVRLLAGEREIELVVIPHLYDLAPEGPALVRLRAIEGDMVVLSWLYPRAAFWVLNAHGIKGRLGAKASLFEADRVEPSEARKPLSARTIWCFDLRTIGRPERCVDQVLRIARSRIEGRLEQAGRAQTGVHEVVETIRPRWYPVVDYSRCAGCLECVNFCLFGVYGLGQDNLPVVEQPDACRPGCPACARVCPQKAIMFPQHHEPGIAGDPDASPQGLIPGISPLSGGQGPTEVAESERRRVLVEQQARKPVEPTQQTHSTPDRDDLERLVDEVDKLDL